MGAIFTNYEGMSDKYKEALEIIELQREQIIKLTQKEYQKIERTRNNFSPQVSEDELTNN